MVQERTTSIAKERVNDGKLIGVRNGHPLSGKKSVWSKFKAGNKEDEEQWTVATTAAGNKSEKQQLVANTVAAKVQHRQGNSKANQKVIQKVWSLSIYKDPKT